ncbi:TonB-dependent siderophore receptor [Telmatospirillum sp. J64-1]|uniref:TonB-dependent receptor n=1 Tax=Telmatospirillum sp. J64-1 TaxID=2502183 RepID=UPI00115EAFBA|nr:TonB-dependent siderophore receptor [Telmatospirillum sp. J64-1]
MSFRRSVSLATLLLASAAPVFAADSEAEPAGEEVLQLSPVTVTGQEPAAGGGLNLDQPGTAGSRLTLTPLETPASVEIISGETIRNRGQSTISEAVTQNATGFTSIGTPGNGGTALTTRGFAGHGSVMRLYDGSRFYVGAGTVTFPFDTWAVDRVEVLRGPASVLYGEGAIGGVVNVVPRSMREKRNEAMLAGGSHGTVRAAAGSAGPVNEKLSYRLDVSGSRSDGWVDRDDTRSLALSAAVQWQVTPDASLTISHDYGYQEPQRYFGTPLINGALDKGLRRKNYNVEDSRIVYRDHWTQVKGEWAVTEALTLRNTTYLLNSDRHWRNAESYQWNATTGLIDRSDYIEIRHDQQQVGNRFDATLRGTVLGMKNEVTTGFEINRIDFEHSNNSPYGGSSSVDPYNPDPGRFINVAGTMPRYKSRTDQHALFLDNRLSLTDKLSVVGGLRYDAPKVQRDDLIGGTRYSKTFHTTSWRAGAVYEALPGLALYGQYATAVDPVGNLISMNPTQIDWELSTGRQVEVGIKHSFLGGRGEWTLAGFHIVKDNLLTRDPDNPAVTVQVGEQSSRGIEASLSLGLWEGVRLDANGTILDARYDEFVQSVGGTAVSYAGNVPRNIPERVANVWASWAFAPAWEAMAGMQYVGRTYSDDANLYSRPSYTVFNLGLDHRPTDNTKLSLRAFNLFDEVYAVSGNSTSWLLGRPRSVELSLSMAF